MIRAIDAFWPGFFGNPHASFHESLSFLETSGVSESAVGYNQESPERRGFGELRRKEESPSG